MGWEAWVTLLLLAAAVVGMTRSLLGPDVALLGVVALLATLQAATGTDRLPTTVDALGGFANSGLLTVALLFIVARGLTATGATDLITGPLLRKPRTVGQAQWRVLPPVAALSAFVNNTPIVAMFIPVLNDWCRRTGQPASRLMLPLSYAAILGGTCTLVGTSTNLVVYGLLDPTAQARIGLFTIALIGAPVAIAGLVYIYMATPRLLPGHAAGPKGEPQDRSYTVEMRVDPGGPVDGRSIANAGLRSLSGLYLADIERDGERLIAVGPEQVLHGNDRLIFVGLVSSVVDLQKMRGLTPATSQVFKLNDPRPDRQLIEVVVSDANPIVGRTIRAGAFRSRYHAVVIAVHRHGERLEEKIGDVVLSAGDTLLLEAHPRFIEAHRDRRDFFLVSSVADSKPPRYHRAWTAVAVLVGMIIVVGFGWLSMLHAALLAAGLMVVTRCLTMAEARDAVDVRTVLVIAGAIGLGLAMNASGAAAALADGVLAVAQPFGPLAVLLAVWLITVVLTEMISNVGAAVLTLPIAMAAATHLEVDALPFVFVVMMAASASFATPIGYQTNLMVYGAGGYRFADYLRFGLPLTLITGIITVTLAPWLWPFLPA